MNLEQEQAACSHTAQAGDEGAAPLSRFILPNYIQCKLLRPAGQQK